MDGLVRSIELLKRINLCPGKVAKIGVAVGTSVIAAGNFVEGNLEFLENILKTGKEVVDEVEEVAEVVENVVEESKEVVEEIETVVEKVKEAEDVVKKGLDEAIEVVGEVEKVEKEVVEVVEEAAVIVKETEKLVEEGGLVAAEGVSMFKVRYLNLIDSGKNLKKGLIGANVCNILMNFVVTGIALISSTQYSQAIGVLAEKISKLWHIILCLIISSHLLYLHSKRP